MGKASSNKKVARAAGTGGGRTYRGRTPWSYFGVIALIVVLGIVGTVTSRDRRLAQINSQGNTAPTVGTTWHEGYAVYACGKFLPFIQHAKDPQGITTNQDGIILIQPKVKSAAGKNATLGKFASAVGMTLNAAEVQLPGGTLYQDGNKCDGKTGHLYVKQFGYVGDTIGQLYNGDTKHGQLAKLDPRQIPLQDGVLLTIAFVPSSDASKIPPPPAKVGTALTALLNSSSSPTTTPGTTPTTAPATTSTTTKK